MRHIFSSALNRSQGDPTQEAKQRRYRNALKTHDVTVDAEEKAAADYDDAQGDLERKRAARADAEDELLDALADLDTATLGDLPLERVHKRSDEPPMRPECAFVDLEETGTRPRRPTRTGRPRT